jgi:HSP20 family protein
MSMKKWIPWNWFKKEEEESGKSVPVRRNRQHDQAPALSGSLVRFQQEIDRLFEHAFRGVDLMPLGFNRPLWPRMNDGLLRPTLDLGATDNAYTVSVEVPGVDEKDVKVEIANDALTIRGEKKQEIEEKDKNYYRMERSYGSFERVLSLPEDADQEGIAATFKNGVLKVSMPRIAAPQAHVKQIEIQSA